MAGCRISGESRSSRGYVNAIYLISAVLERLRPGTFRGNRRDRTSADVELQEREAEFRDQSESTNARVVRWTLIQLAVLGVTCAWQLSHLRAFFIKQKLT